jgi:hypothetical protein
MNAINNCKISPFLRNTFVSFVIVILDEFKTYLTINFNKR